VIPDTDPEAYLGYAGFMDEKQFRKHLADLAHGHHHPEEHDWGEGTIQKTAAPTNIAPVEPASVVKTAKAKSTKKRSRKK
jgi:hypothetical protein